MLGLITARTVSKGRYGRSKEITSCVPKNIDAPHIMTESEAEMGAVFSASYRHQSAL
jgi:hypothetical protein